VTQPGHSENIFSKFYNLLHTLLEAKIVIIYLLLKTILENKLEQEDRAVNQVCQLSYHNISVPVVSLFS